MNSLQKLIFFSAAAVLGFGILTSVSTKAATFSDLSITVAETGLWSRTIVDGREGDTDGVVNNKISIDFLPKNQSPFSFMVSSIDPKEPVVIAEATAKSVKLILTNLRQWVDNVKDAATERSRTGQVICPQLRFCIVNAVFRDSKGFLLLTGHC